MKPQSSHPSTDHCATAALAYQFYLDEGRPEGRDLEHWLRAERVLSGQGQGTAGDSKLVALALHPGGGPHLGAQPNRPELQLKPGPDNDVTATRESIRRQASASRPAPRESARPVERSHQTR